MEYVVLQTFEDSETGRIFQAGKKYPVKTRKDRINQLLSSKRADHPNFKGPLIELVDNDAKQVKEA